jgi:hypothetical protein
LLIATPAGARDALGVFENWGAFRDARPPRCYAITQPVRRSNGAWKPFASVAFWPTVGQRNQVAIRLSRERAAGSKVTLHIGDRSFELVAGSVDAWAPDARTDVQIVAAMRSATSMSVEARSKTGTAFADGYRLRGAATAIDAAALGCARG